VTQNHNATAALLEGSSLLRKGRADVFSTPIFLTTRSADFALVPASSRNVVGYRHL